VSMTSDVEQFADTAGGLRWQSCEDVLQAGRVQIPSGSMVIRYQLAARNALARFISCRLVSASAVKLRSFL
jgi:hypothetical protein